MFSRIRTAISATLMLGLMLLPATAQAQPDTPDITGWNQVSFTTINISLEGESVIYLGYEAEYRNPANQNEFVKVLGRFISFVSVPASGSEKTPYAEVANNYLELEVNEAIQGQIDKADIFHYVRWKTAINTQTRQVVLDGLVERWLLGPTGAWFYSAGENDKLLVMEISVPNKYNAKQYVKVGIQYMLKDTVHIIRTDEYYFINSRKR